MEKSLSDNEMIAEFMGMSEKHIEKCDISYDTNWSMLMPVVEKIEVILSVPNASKKKDWHHWNNVFDGRIDTDIKVAYACVVEFIKWHSNPTS